MNKSIQSTILGLFIILVLVFTNPQEQEHKSTVKAKFETIMQRKLKENLTANNNDTFAQLGQGLGVLFGGYLIDKIIDAGITRDNYILFSTTTFTYEGQSKTIGIGVLGNVYLSSKIDEALKDAAK